MGRAGTQASARIIRRARRGARWFFYGPPNYLVTKFSSEDRRMIGFWTLIVAAVGSIPFGSKVLWVTIISVAALVPNFASETPVETEDA